ncbi:uncharacterized protein FA14DRAFT_160017 [Meira miltonrushii]|uniref:Uncharacterized protein n=1 Tax=Meira miltonrushii TaxID=1280837 RepID=A0A316VLR0_9BASI|nr:uncharacterized protein FA14DRAFT_160017 [Meira miltonrushii]PWN38457.1 hypothetical protein FA14DRAFT_160017 [Meira miltonrushii]
MPHAAVIAAAATMGVAAAVAFEVSVFKPWREENYPEGFAEGMRTEWNEIKDEFRRGFWDFRDRVRNEANANRHGGPRDPFSDMPASPPLSPQRHQSLLGASKPEKYHDDEEYEEMRQVQRDLDEFEMTERQSLFMNRRLQTEFANDQTVRRRKPLTAAKGEGQEQIPSVDSDLFKSASGKVTNDLDSPHHNIGASSPTVSPESLKGGVLPEITNTTTTQDAEAVQQNTTRSSTVSDDEEWFSRASSPIRIEHDEDGMESGNVSDAWTQLENSPPGTPTSGSWSAIEHSSNGRD